MCMTSVIGEELHLADSVLTKEYIKANQDTDSSHRSSKNLHLSLLKSLMYIYLSL